MFGFVEKQKKWVQIGLIVVSLPFVATGMMSYLDHAADKQNLVQLEGNHQIPEALFEQKWAEYRQTSSGNALKPADQKQMVLDGLIEDQLFSIYAERQRFSVNEETVKHRIGQEAAFRDETGNFSLAQYQKMLKQIGQSEPQFESAMYHMMVRQSVENSARVWIAQPILDYWINVYENQHVIRRLEISSDRYAKDILVTDETAKAYYTAHQKQYAEPEKIQLETLEATAEAAAKNAVIEANDIKDYYEKNKSQFSTAETRNVKHILLKIDSKANALDKQKKREQLEQWLKELKATPGKFAEYAKKYSEDAGSAPEGGDLGAVSRGAMVKPFEDAVFNATANSIVGPVETQYGYHLIQIGTVQPSMTKSFESVKADIEQTLKQQQAHVKQEQWVSMMEKPNQDMASLAKETGLELKKSAWLDVKAAAEFLGNKTGLAAQLMENGQKKELKALPLQELTGQRFVLIRVAAYQAPNHPAFENVKAKVIADIQKEKGIAKAREEGVKLLKALQAKEKITLPGEWAAPETIAFRRTANLSKPLQKQIFSSLPKAGNPVYRGGDNEKGFVLIAIDAQIAPAIDEAKRQQMRYVMNQILAQRGREAFARSFKTLYKVKVNEERWNSIKSRKEDIVSEASSDL
ncbi:MAG: peptidylprolyl isomerase [Pseudomonadota bacterium]